MNHDESFAPSPLRDRSHFAGAGLAALLLLAAPTQTSAQWAPNGVQVVAWGGISPTLLGDGSGGALLAWDHQGSIRYEPISSAGTVPPGLPGGGASVYASLYDQRHPTLLSDGAGGSYLVWADERWAGCTAGCTGLPLEIFVVRLLGDGSVAPGWPAGGIQVGAPPQSWWTAPQACIDGAGGVIVAWSEPLPTDDGNIRARRFGPDGTSVWGSSPSTVCANVHGQFAPRLAPDGTGGAFIVWQDDRAILGGLGLFAQHISGAGALQWNAQGVSLSTTPGAVAEPAQLIADAGGGAYFAWNETSGLSNIGHLSSSGSVDWAFDLGTLAGDLRVSETGSGGVFVAWSDGDLHLMHLGADGGGVPGWVGPEIVCDAPGPQGDVRIAPDDAGGAYLLWADQRTGGNELFATHLGSDGNPAAGWPANGRVVCSAANTRVIQALVRDGVGGAIALWDDQRDIPTEVLYAQRLVAGGLLSTPEPRRVATFALFAPHPNPVRGAVNATFELPDAVDARLELLDVLGRRVQSREVGSLGRGRHTVTILASGVPPGVYVLRLARADGVRTTRVAVLSGAP